MILFIHRKDLRTHDLPAFDLIQAAGERSLHVLILEPFCCVTDGSLNTAESTSLLM